MTYVDSDGVLADFAGWIESIKPGALSDNDEVYRILISHCDEVYLDFKKADANTTTMAFSSLVFAECFTDEKLDKFIRGVVDAVDFYGGVTQYFVPDNLKTAITKHTKDRLTVNSLFKDLESFYETVILPPPPRKPKGKPTVEAHVSYLETHLVEKLKEETYTCIEDINRKTRQPWILCTTGAYLVLAGPGTGKTFTVIHRNQYMRLCQKYLMEMLNGIGVI